MARGTPARTLRHDEPNCVLVDPQPFGPQDAPFFEGRVPARCLSYGLTCVFRFSALKRAIARYGHPEILNIDPRCQYASEVFTGAQATPDAHQRRRTRPLPRHHSDRAPVAGGRARVSLAAPGGQRYLAAEKPAQAFSLDTTVCAPVRHSLRRSRTKRTWTGWRTARPRRQSPQFLGDRRSRGPRPWQDTST